MDKKDKIVADLEKTFGHFKDCPGYDELFADFIKMSQEHSEWQKPSDLPIAKEFPEINLDNNKEFNVILRGILAVQGKITGRYKKVLDAGGKEYADFIWSLIQDLSAYSVVAHLLQVKLSLTNYLNDEANKDHVLH